MSKVYEDEFMELQSGMISLCLELVQEKVDEIYVYGSIEESSTSFNAFLKTAGEVKTLNKMEINSNTV